MSSADIDRDHNANIWVNWTGWAGEKRMSVLVRFDVQLWIVRQQAAGLDTSAIDPLCRAVMFIVRGTLHRDNFPGHGTGDRSVATQLEMIEMQL